MNPPDESFLKWDNPVLVTKTDRSSSNSIDSTILPTPSTPQRSFRHLTGQALLNAILPPRVRIEGDKMWMQQVSSVCCTPADLGKLEEQLDRKLGQKQARETAICPVRSDLYFQCFDELIRQETINCAERGLMLLRVRDESQKTIAAYNTLYESSIAFGMRKALQAEQHKIDMMKRISNLENEKHHLHKQLDEQKAKLDAVKKMAIERQVEQDKYIKEIQFLERSNQQLKRQVEAITSMK